MKLIAYNWLLIYYETLLTATSFLLILLIKDKLTFQYNALLDVCLFRHSSKIQIFKK